MMMYHDGCFSQYSQFRYFDLNSEMECHGMHWPTAGCCKTSMDDLGYMIGCKWEVFSNRILHFATNLKGSRQYLFKQQNNLITVVDSIELLSILFNSALLIFSGLSWQIQFVQMMQFYTDWPSHNCWLVLLIPSIWICEQIFSWCFGNSWFQGSFQVAILRQIKYTWSSLVAQCI